MFPILSPLSPSQTLLVAHCLKDLGSSRAHRIDTEYCCPISALKILTLLLTDISPHRRITELLDDVVAKVCVFLDTARYWLPAIDPPLPSLKTPLRASPVDIPGNALDSSASSRNQEPF